MSLIRMGALGSKRGIGIDPATLSPTGHWIGGVGITLNTAPDPDQISAWADQTGLSPARNFTNTGTSQPREHIYATGKSAPYFRKVRKDVLTTQPTTILNFFSASAYSYMVCMKPGVQDAKNPTLHLNARPISESNGMLGIMVYDSGGTHVTVEARAMWGTGGLNAYYVGPLLVPVGEVSVAWVSYSGGTTKLGTLSSAGLGAASLGGIIDLWLFDGHLRLGQTHSSHQGFEGTILEAATWNTALTDDQLAGVAENLLHRYRNAT